MKKVMMLLLGVSFLLSASAWAGDRAGTVSFSPLFGGCVFEGSQQLKTSAAYGAAVGYNFTDNLGMEFGFSFIDSGTRHGHGQDVDTFFYHMDGLYHVTSWGNFQPYVAAGIGGMTFDHQRTAQNSDNSTDTAFAFNYGGGFEYFIVDNFALRGDLRHVITANGGFNDLLGTVGITVLFGSEKPKPAPMAAAPPPPPPPPVEKAKPTPPPPVEKAKPTPPPPAPKRQEAICILLKVEFDFDKDNVKPEYGDDIRRVADFLKANPTFKGTIVGGTDSVGSDEYNLDLSIRRAESVKRYIVDNFGIDSSKLGTVGFGKSEPVATNLTEEGRQRNRRATRVYCSSGEDVPPTLKPQKCIVLKVEFAAGSSKIEPGYNESFKEMANYMKDNPAYVGTIEGYADADGSDNLNMELSIKRAEAVKKQLVDEYGIPADRLNTRGLGKRRPIASNDTPEGRAANRYAVQVICEPE